MASRSSSSTTYAVIANTASEFDPRRVSADLQNFHQHHRFQYHNVQNPKIEPALTTPTATATINTANVNNQNQITSNRASQEQERQQQPQQAHHHYYQRYQQQMTTNLNALIHGKTNREVQPKAKNIFRVPNAPPGSFTNIPQKDQRTFLASSSSSALSSFEQSNNNIQQQQQKSHTAFLSNNTTSSEFNIQSNNDIRYVNSQQEEENGGVSSLFSSDWQKENPGESVTEENEDYEGSGQANVKKCAKTNRTPADELRRESDSLLNIEHNNYIPVKQNNNNNNTDRRTTTHEATIFDLRFEDRQRIANLICQLANSQEQVEMLEYRVEKHEEHSRQKIGELVKKVELLTERCKFLVAQNASQLQTNGRSERTKQKKEKLEDIQAKTILQQKQQLAIKVSQLEDTNKNLQNTLTQLETKYHRCTEDNQRLKFILKKIQEREEILLTHNKCYLNSGEEEERRKESQQSFGVNTTMSPESHIEILKNPNKNSSFVSSKRETTPEDEEEEENRREQQLRQRKISDDSQLENIQRRNRNSGGDFYNNAVSDSRHRYNNNNVEDFHEYPVYEPHLIIPSMNSPVIMKIPKSPMVLQGRFPARPQISNSHNNPNNTSGIHSNHNRHLNLGTIASPSTLTSTAENINISQSRHIEEQNNNETPNYNEETILRELFFTF